MAFTVEDLVFAKLKGYRPWPAKIQNIDTCGKISVFFYGTYEKGVLKNDKNIWLFSPATKEKFGKVSNANTPSNKLFLKAVNELENKPEIANQKPEPLQIRITSTTSITPIFPPVSPASSLLSKQHRSDRKIYVQVKDTEEFIEIDLDKETKRKRPLNLSLHEHLEWEKANLKEALKFKKMVEEGKYVPEEVVVKLEKKANMTDKEKAVYDKWKILQGQRKEKIKWLKSERRLVKIEKEFRHCLNPTSPDLQRCIQILDEMTHLQMSPLMFKKQPQVMSTMDKMRCYVGPKQGMELDELVQKVRTKSKAIYLKMQSSFDTPMNTPFKEFFESELEKFNAHCQELSVEQVAFMTCE